MNNPGASRPKKDQLRKLPPATLHTLLHPSTRWGSSLECTIQTALFIFIFCPLRGIIEFINNVLFLDSLGKSEKCHEDGILSDRFHYNILDNVIIVGFPHKNQRSLGVLCGIWAGHWKRLPMVRVWPKLVLSDQLNILYFLTCHKCASLLEDEVSLPSGSF